MGVQGGLAQADVVRRHFDHLVIARKYIGPMIGGAEVKAADGKSSAERAGAGAGGLK